MKRSAMNQLIAHCDRFFAQKDPVILHPIVPVEPHIDVLLYKPDGTFPYWKLVTMGASDYKMKPQENTLGNRNEYMMLIAPSENLYDKETLHWYHMNLLEVATYSMATGTPVSYGHSMEWGEEEGTDMVGAYLEMPQFSRTTAFMRCKLGFMHEIIILQAVLLTRPEVNRLLEIGSDNFSDYLYPEEGKSHILCERYRSEKF